MHRCTLFKDFRSRGRPYIVAWVSVQHDDGLWTAADKVGTVKRNDTGLHLSHK